MKRLLTQAPTLAYFDPCKGLTIQCDASGQGLGVALLQDGQPLAYASRALSGAETRYATIEKEMLAIVFAPGEVAPIHIWSPRECVLRS